MMLTFGVVNCHAEVGNKAATPPAEKNKPACTSDPCGNTATGEDPADVYVREGAKITAELRNSPDDKRRWSSIALYSDTKSPERLKVAVVKAADFTMQLDPKKGWLTFSTPKLQQVFNLATPIGEKNNPCSKYSVKIVEASSSYAVVKKICPLSEYVAGKYFMQAEYYLYDQESSTMRTIWSAALTNPDAEFPDATPELAMKAIKDGYRLDWTGLFPEDGKWKKTSIHNNYLRKKDSAGKGYLQCSDATAKGKDGLENELCEGGILTLVSSQAGAK